MLRKDAVAVFARTLGRSIHAVRRWVGTQPRSKREGFLAACLHSLTFRGTPVFFGDLEIRVKQINSPAGRCWEQIDDPQLAINYLASRETVGGAGDNDTITLILWLTGITDDRPVLSPMEPEFDQWLTRMRWAYLALK